jgi:Uma2 family endonuclease
MSTITPLMTVEELQQIPDDCHPRELRRGELLTMSPPGPDHGGVCARVCRALFQYLAEHDLGQIFINDTGYLLEEHPDTVLGPDLSFISKQRLKLMQKRRGYFFGPPDLAIEVISPNDRIKDVHDKAQDLVNFGASEAWVIHPHQRTLTIFTRLNEPIKLKNADILRDRDVLPGFECLVSNLIGELLFDN